MIPLQQTHKRCVTFHTSHPTRSLIDNKSGNTHLDPNTYFITQVTYQRDSWLCSDMGRKALREGIEKVRKKYPFAIDAFVLLPDHFHCLWTLPVDDDDLSVRLRLIKTYVTKHYGQELGINREIS